MAEDPMVRCCNSLAGIQQDQQQGNFDVRSWRKLLVPPAHKLYIPWCTFVVILALCCIFFYMAGELPLRDASNREGRIRIHELTIRRVGIRTLLMCSQCASSAAIWVGPDITISAAMPEASIHPLRFALTLNEFCTPGGYATYLGGDAAPQSYTPNNLRQWLRFSADPRHTFNFSYLLLWGGQYLPAIYQSQGWRWVTAGEL